MKEGSEGETPIEKDIGQLQTVLSEVSIATHAPPVTEGATGGACAESPTSEKGGSRTGRGSSGGSRGEAAARDKVFVCGVCQRCFGYKHVLQNHERTHTGEKPFECKECHKRFTRDHHLKTHMRLHTGEKPYHCTHCERQFVQVANLRRHLRVHTGERPYHCELCVSRFSDSNQLKAHMLIHKGEKPFKCEQCLGRFRRRHHLMHHKCPKELANQGKPKRGRRPKTAEDLERDSAPQTAPPDPQHHHLHRHLALEEQHEACGAEPTIVPVETTEQLYLQRPVKRERKPRETRRIIKVEPPPPMLVLGGSDPGCHYQLVPTTPTATSPLSFRSPPPEQTEPEDLSMHANSGDKNGNRRVRTPPTPPAHHRPPRILMAEDDDDNGDESEAMVEEEEVEEEDDDDDSELLELEWRRPGGIRPRHYEHHHRIDIVGRNVDREPEEMEHDDLDDVAEFRRRIMTADVSSEDGSDSDGLYERHHRGFHHGHELDAETGNGNSRPRFLTVPAAASSRRHHHQPHHHLLHHPIHLAPHHQIHMPLHYQHHHLVDPMLDVRTSTLVKAAAATSAVSTQMNSMSPHQKNTQGN